MNTESNHAIENAKAWLETIRDLAKRLDTQQDTRERVVAIANLRAMCERHSGVAHRYWIEKVSRSRVHVGYSNPNEYGTESPMYAVFPAMPDPFDPKGCVIDLDRMLRVIGDNWQGNGDQAFSPILLSPVLWRSPHTGEWHTEEEIKAKQS